MHRRLAILSALGLMAPIANAQVSNLRITEVIPVTDQVEITNTGPAFTTTSAHPFCHRFNYASSIPAGTSFAAGEVQVFTVSNLNDNDSDLWLYSSPPFGVALNIVHGLKYGPAANIGRSALAATVGLWPSGTAFIPTPGAGQSLSFDGLGNAPSDWYVDDSPSLGQNDPQAFGTVQDGLDVPSGTEDFEQVPLGDPSTALIGWPLVDSGTVNGDFDVRVVGDIAGTTPAPGSSSTRWLRVRDQDASASQNRFYSRFLSSGGAFSYRMTFDVILLEVPPASSTNNKPRVTIQHQVPTGVTNTWGIEFDSAGATLVVLPNGGPAATASLGALPTGVAGRVSLLIDLASGTATADLTTTSTASATLPIAPAANVDITNARFCYRGEGVGNVGTILLDDIGFGFEFCQQDLGSQGPGNATASLCGFGLGPGLTSTYEVTGAPANVAGGLLVSVAGQPDIPALGGTLVSFSGFAFNVPLVTDANGELSIPVTGSGTQFQVVFQSAFIDLSAPSNVGLSNALLVQWGL